MSQPVVVAGWGQTTQHKDHSGPLLDPLGLMEEAAQRAATVAGGGEVLRELDAILVVRPLSRDLRDPARRLAATFGATPRFATLSGIGGNTPQLLVNRAAGMIVRGEARSVLIVGAETFYPRSKEQAMGEHAIMQGVPPDYADDDLVGSSELEQRHGISLPIHGFPMFETALWGLSHLPLARYLEEVGGMWAGFSAVAARNPYAWTRTARTAHELVTPSEQNRPVAFPYTKQMVSLVTVDTGAALILRAPESGTRRRQVYFRGGGYAVDRQRFLIERTSYTLSTPLELATDKASARAGMTLDEVDAFDLYSCFPSAVSVARRTLHLRRDDPRPLTVTGGLGFFGGPGNNYALHAIAGMAEEISSGRVEKGFVSAIGWFMHKLAVGFYAATPGTTDHAENARLDDENPLTAIGPVPVAEAVNGSGTIETYTVIYTRERTPSHAILYGRTADGLRFIAQTERAPGLIGQLTTTCCVGREVTVRHDAATGLNLARW
ncbi:MAG: hypothetical protein HY943_10105 [Gammaproteobacteria bacterium]|nr:hypothetical protein [Gammaproteobacteria bacterium]